MRVPFALPLNIGTDLVQLHRIWQVSRPNSERFARLARRILQPAELELLTRQHREWQDLGTAPANRQESARSWLAGRWAAKEAAKKAWGATLLGFEDLRVERVNEDGEIQILCAPLPRGDAEPLEQIARLSISHEGNYAVATVLATPLDEGIIAELARRKAEAEKRVNGGQV